MRTLQYAFVEPRLRQSQHNDFSVERNVTCPAQLVANCCLLYANRHLRSVLLFNVSQLKV